MHNFQEMVQRQARSWQDGNIDGFVADFAPDGPFISPGGHWQGHAQIRVAATAFLAEVAAVKISVMRVFGAADQGAAEFILNAR